MHDRKTYGRTLGSLNMGSFNNGYPALGSASRHPAYSLCDLLTLQLGNLFGQNVEEDF